MQKEIITNNAKETQDLGKAMAKEILEKGPLKTAVVLALQGNLGGGKTTFLQGFAEGLNIKDKILSPTFVVMKRFHLPSLRGNRNCRSNLKVQIASSPVAPRNDNNFTNFYHIDCYRIKNEKPARNASSASNASRSDADWHSDAGGDILDLGLKEIILDPKNIVAIEWSEKIKEKLSKSSIIIKFKFIGESKRQITTIF